LRAKSAKIRFAEIIASFRACVGRADIGACQARRFSPSWIAAKAGMKTSALSPQTASVE
jgi:hypothetical protein